MVLEGRLRCLICVNLYDLATFFLKNRVFWKADFLKRFLKTDLFCVACQICANFCPRDLKLAKIRLAMQKNMVFWKKPFYYKINFPNTMFFLRLLELCQFVLAWIKLALSRQATQKLFSKTVFKNRSFKKSWFFKKHGFTWWHKWDTIKDLPLDGHPIQSQL